MPDIIVRNTDNYFEPKPFMSSLSELSHVSHADNNLSIFTIQDSR